MSEATEVGRFSRMVGGIDFVVLSVSKEENGRNKAAIPFKFRSANEDRSKMAMIGWTLTTHRREVRMMPVEALTPTISDVGQDFEVSDFEICEPTTEGNRHPKRQGSFVIVGDASRRGL